VATGAATQMGANSLVRFFHTFAIMQFHHMATSKSIHMNVSNNMLEQQTRFGWTGKRLVMTVIALIPCGYRRANQMGEKSLRFCHTVAIMQVHHMATSKSTHMNIFKQSAAA
jgi:hypothetical protein